MSTFCQRSYRTNCQHRGVCGQKSQNLVNVVCERPLKYLSFYSDIAIFQVLLVTWLACPWQLNRQCQIMLYTDHPWEKLQTEIFRWHAFYLRLCCGPLVRLSPYLVHRLAKVFFTVHYTKKNFFFKT